MASCTWGKKLLTQRVAPGPTTHGGQGIDGAHRLAVMKPKPVAQGERPDPAFVFDGISGCHLRLRHALAIQSKTTCVVDQEGMGVDDRGCCPKRGPAS